MKKEKFDSELFYVGFPVFIALVKGENDEILATTYSSSYMLENQLIMGVSAEGNTATHLQVGTKLSVNYLDADSGILADIAGLISHRTRLSVLTEMGAQLTEVDGIPLLENGSVSIIGEVNKVVNHEGINHLFITITDRFVDEELLVDGKVFWENMSALEYFGAKTDRFYKAVSSDKKKKGQFLKESRKHDTRK